MNRRLRFRIDKSRTEKVDTKLGFEMHTHIMSAPRYYDKWHEFSKT